LDADHPASDDLPPSADQSWSDHRSSTDQPARPLSEPVAVADEEALFEPDPDFISYSPPWDVPPDEPWATDPVRAAALQPTLEPVPEPALAYEPPSVPALAELPAAPADESVIPAHDELLTGMQDDVAIAPAEEPAPEPAATFEATPAGDEPVFPDAALWAYRPPEVGVSDEANTGITEAPGEPGAEAPAGPDAFQTVFEPTDLAGPADAAEVLDAGDVAALADPSDQSHPSDPSDLDDAFAPIADDLLVSAAPSEPAPEVWPERDLAATMVVSHDAGSADQFEPTPERASEADAMAASADALDLEPELEPAARVADLAPAAAAFDTPAPEIVAAEPLLAWPVEKPAASVFGDLFTAPAHPEDGGTDAPPDAGPDALAAWETGAPAVGGQSEVEWPPVPTGVFPPLPHLLPTLNVEAPPEGEVGIEWPDDPRPQTFWPDTPAPAEPVDEAPEWDSWLSRPPTADSEPDPQADLEFAPRFVPPPTRPLSSSAPEDPADDRHTLVFSDPLPDPIESSADDVRDGAFARFASQATALAEMIPDRWSLPVAPKFTSASDDVAARDFSDVQSPALTVLFAIVVIAAVLLFIYLVTPLLR
jgi:hypothetical protein